MIDAATKKARREVEALAARLGATVRAEREERRYNVRVEAPPGHHWASDGVHEIVASSFVGPWSFADVWDDVLGRMREGVELCTDECEWWTA